MIAKSEVLAAHGGGTGTAERSAGVEAIDELRSMLVEQRRMLLTQARVIEALDHRREEIEELVEIAMPIANNAVRIGIERLASLDADGTFERARHAVMAVRGAIQSEPPTLWRLWRRLRTPESRRGLAALAEVVHAVGASGAGMQT